MKNKSIIILIFMVMAVAVSFAMNMKSEPTFNLMGIEMTREQAIEHCQEMPQMEVCGAFGIEADDDSMSETMDSPNGVSEEMGEKMNGMSEEMAGEISEEMCQRMPELAGCESFITETES